MSFQAVFKRYEFKYIITESQKQRILNHIKPFMTLDQYGQSRIGNIYFDTDSYLLIRRSIEKPIYKEKLRIRSYSRNSKKVFVELKKKYKHVVYKRRIAMDFDKAMNFLSGNDLASDGQISKEIEYFIEHYKTLHPTLYLSYRREAFYANDGSDFRLTFDDDVKCRQTDFHFLSDEACTAILPEGTILMEIKCSGGIPLWMTELLSKEHIYKTSFSKYGTAYRNLIFPQLNSKKI